MTDCIDIWQADLRTFAVSDVMQGDPALTEEDIAKSNSFRQETHRFRTLVGRLMLRLASAQRVGCDPSALKLAENHAGKPYWENAELCFNLSHSGDYVWLAIGGKQQLGLDIQHQDPNIDTAAIADYALHPSEMAYLEDQPEPAKRPAFFDLWVLREAALKASGESVFVSMKTVHALPMTPIGTWGAAKGFGIPYLMVQRLQGPENYKAALAMIKTDQHAQAPPIAFKDATHLRL